MIGISVSLYDKFDDLAVLTDIVRENWDDDYYLSVCSNHPDAEERMAALDLDVDSFVAGAPINYDPAMTGLREQVNRICRVYDTVRRAATNALEADGVDHVMHVHADAWPLSESSLERLVSDMVSRDQPVAFKGRGLGDRGVNPIGHLMDQYFVLDADYAVEKGFFEHSPLELLPDRGIHTMLMVLLVGKVGWSNVYHYSDQSEQEYWDGAPATGVRPMMYNPEWDQVHIATEDYPDDLGKSLQAMYLAEYGLTEGSHLGDLVAEHHLERDRLLARLAEVEAALNDRLRFFTVDDVGRNFRVAREYLDRSAAGKAVYLLRGGINRVAKRVASLEPLVERLVDEPVPRYDPVARGYPERNLDEVYADALRAGDFPPAYERDLWFRR